MEALSHDWEEIFSICLFCWIRVGCWEIFGDGRHFSRKGSCNNLYKVNVLCFVPDPCIPGECCILFESLDLCGFKTGKNTERSLLVTELEHFERLKPIKRVIFYCFIRKIVQLSQVNLSKIPTILLGSLSVPQQPMRVLCNRKDRS